MKNQSELTSFNVEEIEERLEFCSCPSNATEINRGWDGTHHWVSCEYEWHTTTNDTFSRNFDVFCD